MNLGQAMKTLDWRRGLLRTWIALSALWVVALFALERPDRSIVAYSSLGKSWLLVATPFGTPLTVDRPMIRVEDVLISDESAVMRVAKNMPPIAMPPGLLPTVKFEDGWEVTWVFADMSALVEEARRRELIHSARDEWSRRWIWIQAPSGLAVAKLQYFAAAAVAPPVSVFALAMVILWIARGFKRRG